MVKVRIKCRKCGFTTEVDINPCPSFMKPKKQAKGLKIKYSKSDLDQIMEAAKGAGLKELSQIGLKIEPEEYLEAEERLKIRQFLRKNIKIAKDLRRSKGERAKLGTEDWRMGDKMSEVNLPASEIASMGDPDLRMIPGVTLKKNAYIELPGQDYEIMKGIKFISFLDVSGSMFDSSKRKIKKALTLCEETWRICNKLNFAYYLAIFTDYGHIVEDCERFFRDESYRSSLRMGGGTSLTSALNLFSDERYKDANIMIISDMELGDVHATIEKMKHISLLTNSFRIILVKYKGQVNEVEVKKIKSWFPEENVDVLGMEVAERR